MIPQETVNLIVESAHIEDVVSDYVTLRRRGANYVACCPFHNEKTPSFYVSPAKGIYKCFGCGKAGDAVHFVMEQEQCSYVDALRALARKYKIEVYEREESAEEIAKRQRQESLLLVSEFAEKFYAGQLASGEGLNVGYAYFRKRGITDDTIRKFGLGWAPSSRTALTDAALAAGYKEEFLVDSGLAVRQENGSLVDKFRERAMFPIHSVSGRVIAFSGRTLRSDNPAKYVNSPETEIYRKSRILLGIYFAKSEINRLHKCILVEGNVDMVMMHQLGIRNVVASCGTSLTVEQIRLIHRFTEDITIMYDGDSAGIHAALRGIDLVLAEGLNVKVVLLPEGDDPDSFSRRHTMEEVQNFISSNERDFIEFKTELLLGEAAGDPLKKANLINDIADTIAVIPDPVKRSVYLDSTAFKFGIESSILFDRVSAERRKAREQRGIREAREAREARDTMALKSGALSVDAAREKAGKIPVGRIPENRTLELSERELSMFLLTNGCDELVFESDSDYYSGDEDNRPSVADFIRDAMDADATTFENSLYRRLYELFFSFYDEGFGQEEIVRRMINSPDKEIADTAVELSTEKYLLTVKDFNNALTSKASWLVAFVPKAILVYNERRIQSRVDEIRRSLGASSPEGQESLMRELVKLQAAQRRIKQKIGREKSE